MINNQIKTYAIILNYNSASETVALFKSLEEQHYINFEIIVIDNNSIEADQLELNENIPSQNLLFNPKNLGYAGGNNIGIDRALENNADVVWILNPDIRVEKESFYILLESFKNAKDLAAIGPRIVHRDQPDKIFSDGELIDTTVSFHTYHKNFNRLRETVPEILDYDIDYIDGSSILMSCKAINSIGKIPDNYFLYFEETDWCTTAKNNGWKLAVNRKAVVYNLLSKKKESYHFYYTRNKLMFSKKFNLNYQTLRKKEIETLLNEIKDRFRGKYLKPYFFSRLKGVIAGIVQR